MNINLDNLFDYFYVLVGVVAVALIIASFYAFYDSKEKSCNEFGISSGFEVMYKNESCFVKYKNVWILHDQLVEAAK